ncbi:MAG TPA: peptide-methionine (R)-S-oxide reductase, partial [Accumulibacter sp.]|nr:peptide-methionine (R)-S-oxide reductase [Accumulibacter sp.]
MDRRQSLKWLGLSAWILPVVASSPSLAGNGNRLEKTKKEWSELLPPAAYRILFEEDTERAGSSPLNQEKRDGTFVCAACFLPLFDSAAKYESGTGWPSFWQSLPGAVGTRTDFKLILPRTEY